MWISGYTGGRKDVIQAGPQLPARLICMALRLQVGGHTSGHCTCLHISCVVDVKNPPQTCPPLPKVSIFPVVTLQSLADLELYYNPTSLYKVSPLFNPFAARTILTLDKCIKPKVYNKKIILYPRTHMICERRRLSHEKTNKTPSIVQSWAPSCNFALKCKVF